MVFPTFFNLSLNFARRMIWATVSSQSCFFWLYSSIYPSSAAKNIITLILVMSMCRVISCVVGRGCFLWPVCSLGKTLLAFALLHFALQGQICLLLQVTLDFLLLHSSPLWWRGLFFFFCISSRKSYRSSQNCSTSVSLALVVGA